LERSGNVEDRRRAGPVAAGIGGLGLVGIIVALFAVLSGGSGTDLEGMLQGLQAPAEPVQQTAPAPSEPDDEAMFVEAVLGSTETHWEQVFAAAGRTYLPANLVLFRQSTSSACGGRQPRSVRIIARGTRPSMSISGSSSSSRPDSGLEAGTLPRRT
jgi:hypothetical protein